MSLGVCSPHPPFTYKILQVIFWRQRLRLWRRKHTIMEVVETEQGFLVLNIGSGAEPFRAFLDQLYQHHWVIVRDAGS